MSRTQENTRTNDTTVAEGVHPEAPATRYVVAGFVFVITGVAAAWAIQQQGWSEVASVPVEGVTVFAVLYVLAQSLERAVELVWPFVDRLIVWVATRGTQKSLSTRKSEAIQLVRQATNVGIYTPDPPVDGTANPALDASKAEKVTKEVRNETSLLTQSMAFSFAIVLVVWFQFSIVSAIGFTGVPTWLGYALTALAISGGSAGLHDLISKIQKQKENAEAKPS